MPGTSAGFHYKPFLKQGQHHAQVGLLGPLSSLVLETSKDASCTTAPLLDCSHGNVSVIFAVMHTFSQWREYQSIRLQDEFYQSICFITVISSCLFSSWPFYISNIHWDLWHIIILWAVNISLIQV